MTGYFSRQNLLIERQSGYIFRLSIEAVIKPHNNNMNVYSKTSANDVIILQGIVDRKPKHAASLSFKEQVVSTGIASLAEFSSSTQRNDQNDGLTKRYL
jgi:hypothetical protein